MHRCDVHGMYFLGVLSCVGTGSDMHMCVVHGMYLSRIGDLCRNRLRHAQVY